MDGQLLQAENFLLPNECISCTTVFGKRHKKDNKLSFCPYKPDSAKNNIYRIVQKKLRKKWADKNNFLCFLISLFSLSMSVFLFFCLQGSIAIRQAPNWIRLNV